MTEPMKMNVVVDLNDEKKDVVEPLVEYKVYKSGEVLKHESVIKLYKSRFKEIELENTLLGSFNDKGKYVLPNDVKKELVAIDKQIVDRSEDKILCITQLRNKILSFEVVFQLLQRFLLQESVVRKYYCLQMSQPELWNIKLYLLIMLL